MDELRQVIAGLGELTKLLAELEPILVRLALFGFFLYGLYNAIVAMLKR
jgi:hypothetical protein